MKSVVLFCSLVLTCLTVGSSGSGQSNTRATNPKPDVTPNSKPEAAKLCPFSITGLWKSEATTETNPVFFQFSSDGWTKILSHTPDVPPESFEILAEVRYKLDKPVGPKRLDLIANAGNDILPTGTTSLEITKYDDDSFSTRNTESGERILWERAQTHRYFLTLAARNGSAKQGTASFIMWSVMDGRNIEVEAFGLQVTNDESGRQLPVFGPISPGLSREFESESGKESDFMVRVEMNEPEYAKTHAVLETWTQRLKDNKLPQSSPFLNSVEFLKATVDSVDQCGKEIKFQKPDSRLLDEISKNSPPQRPLEYIKMLRARNVELHIPDAAFPWAWRPMLLSSN